MLLQKQIPNIFSGCVAQSSILKIFSVTCIREIVPYLPQKSLRIDIIFVTFANKSEKLCQIVDRRGINWNGLADSELKQAMRRSRFAFNISKNDKIFNTFLSKQVKNGDLKVTDIHFETYSVQKRLTEKSN